MGISTKKRTTHTETAPNCSTYTETAPNSYHLHLLTAPTRENTGDDHGLMMQGFQIKKVHTYLSFHYFIYQSFTHCSVFRCTKKSFPHCSLSLSLYATLSFYYFYTILTLFFEFFSKWTYLLHHFGGLLDRV